LLCSLLSYPAPIYIYPLFPTRRSSDLDLGNLTFNTTVFNGVEQINMIPGEATAQINVRTIPEFNNSLVEKKLTELVKAENAQGRSEEHTSELQSRFDLVCRLLLEKKK